MLRDWLENECEEIVALLEKKNHDYGSGNLLRAGEVGIVVRLMDKVARLENFYFKSTAGKVADESIEDTVRDIAGYCLMFFLLRKGLLKRLRASEVENEV